MGLVRDSWNRVRAIAALLVVLIVVSTANAASGAAADVARYEPMAPPPLSAKSVYVEDITTGTELFALNPDEPLPPASLTKIVSALVILDRVNLDETVQITADDLVSPEESQVGLVEGDRLTAHDLLRGVLIPSGNDATLALARHIGSAGLGDSISANRAVEEFVNLMNAKAKELGATSSQFRNPTGIDAEGHVMSARDIATLTTTALENPVFAEIVATPNAVLASESRADGYFVQTTNALLLEGAVNGVKTGTTPNAGGCLVTSFLVGPNNVVAVVLGSMIAESTDGAQDNSARINDTRLLLSAVQADYVWLDPATPGVVSGLLDELVVWDVGLAGSELLPVPTARATEVRYRLILGPPAAPSAPAGEIQFFVGDRLLSTRSALQTN
jgi:D-alanyl-D-alanine carboxypeptidase (penicillin-binding protein 5/6)